MLPLHLSEWNYATSAALSTFVKVNPVALYSPEKYTHILLNETLLHAFLTQTYPERELVSSGIFGERSKLT